MGLNEAVPARSEPVVSVLLVTWNGWNLLERCLRSLDDAATMAGELEIVVVDNASSDGTGEKLAIAYPQARYLRLTENCGFAAGNNAGLELVTTGLVFLLNNDTVVEPESIAALLSQANEHPEFSIFAPQMLRMDRPSIVDNRGVYLDRSGHLRQLDSGDQAMPPRPKSEIFGASGGAVLIRREVIDSCGLFDESLGSYQEDGDFALRARAAGFRALHVPEARILHEGSATGDRLPERKLHLIQRNMLIVYRRWFPFRPWSLHSWLGLGYELGQWVRSVLRRQGTVTWRAKRDALASEPPVPPPVTEARRLRRWLGVRGIALES